MSSADEFFEFAHRPFRGTPIPCDYVPVESIDHEVRRLAEVVRQGDGVGILTAPPGAGKTLVCEQLSEELQDRFVAAILSSSGFATRRSLLQAVLFALGLCYENFSEQELRLAVLNFARSVVKAEESPHREGLVLIIDEAHLLNTRLLEELRCLTNHSEGGRPLIRIILCGQLGLEETLVSPSLQAFNYRISCHTTLEPLTLQESADLIAGRLAHAGRNVESVFTAEALETICRVSDGNPRCILQLCDQALTRAAAAQDRPVSVEAVRSALGELKQLPLHWNDSASDQVELATAAEIEWSGEDECHSSDDVTVRSKVDVTAETSAWTNDVAAVEVGSLSEADGTRELGSTTGWSSFEATPDNHAHEQATHSPDHSEPDAVEILNAEAETIAGETDSESDPASLTEVAIDDCYATLDHSARLSDQLPTSEDLDRALTTLASSPVSRKTAEEDSAEAAIERALSDTSTDLRQRMDDIIAAVSMITGQEPHSEEPNSSGDNEAIAFETLAPGHPWQSAGDARSFDVVEPRREAEGVVGTISPPEQEWPENETQAPSARATIPTQTRDRSTTRPYVRLFSQLRKQRA